VLLWYLLDINHVHIWSYDVVFSLNLSPVAYRSVVRPFGRLIVFAFALNRSLVTWLTMDMSVVALLISNIEVFFRGE